ncbi:MAG: hypothetical protein IT165_17655 [Bryobacterales bacterium]|nr:hypothetical protein [Bryobacterales bacterium]
MKRLLSLIAMSLLGVGVFASSVARSVQQTREEEMKVTWEGRLSGDELKGTRKREGGGRGMEFTAKRQ